MIDFCRYSLHFRASALLLCHLIHMTGNIENNARDKQKGQKASGQQIDQQPFLIVDTVMDHHKLKVLFFHPQVYDK